MRPVVDTLEEKISAVMREVANLPDAAATVKASQDERHGDFQANGAMKLAGRLRRTGPEVAGEVVDRLDLTGLADEIAVAGPGFINLRLSTAFIAQAVGEMARDDRLGVDHASPPQTVVVDFSCPNVAKEMHVGHIRSTIIGDSVSRLLEFVGHRVRRINHIGDWGTQFGMLIQYLRREHRDAVTGRKELAISDLEAFYRRARECFDTDPAFKEASRREVVKLQGGDPEALAAWRAICDESRRKFQANYDALDVRLEEMGESFYNDMLPEVVDDLIDRGIARMSEGAICVFLDGFDAPFMVRKRDGGYGYAATDLAALRYRVQTMGARRIVYVTDARQRDHFAQLFQTARRAGYAPENVRLDHAAFGSILGLDGKPLKTREGRNVRLSGVITEAIERALAVVREKNPTLAPEDQEAIAGIIGIGALKYADLSQNMASDYVFDWDRMLALDGDTAPYLQYAYARIRSIFRKGGLCPDDVREGQPVVSEPAERRLAIWLLRYNEIVEQAAADVRPNLISQFLFELAVRFTTFFHECPVLKAAEPARTGRLALCGVTARVLAHGLGLLGIRVSERM